MSYAVKDVIIDNWMKTQKVIDEKDPKIVYYMSMEVPHRKIPGQ